MISMIGWVASPVIAFVIGWLIASLRKSRKEALALRSGVQALLRDRLLTEYRYHAAQGYAGLEERSNYENMYQQYHSLGANGVMDDIHEKFLALPTERREHDD